MTVFMRLPLDWKVRCARTDSSTVGFAQPRARWEVDAQSSRTCSPSRDVRAVTRTQSPTSGALAGTGEVRDRTTRTPLEGAPSGSCIAKPNAPELLFHRATTTPRTDTSRPGAHPLTSWCTSSEGGAGEPSGASGPSRSSQLESASTESAAAPEPRCCQIPESEATRVPSAQRVRQLGFAPRYA